MMNIQEFWTLITGICAFIVSASAAVGVVLNAIKKFKAPVVANEEKIESLSTRLDGLETRLNNHDALFMNDNKRLEGIEEGNKVTQKALLALLSHAIDGNNQKQLVIARDDLQDYLITK